MTNAPADEQTRGRRTRVAKAALIGGLVGFVVGLLLMIIWMGNPFSTANEIRYETLTVASVSGEQGRLCWSESPEDRDAPQECAILTLDPQSSVPEEGDTITAGLVDIGAPDGTTRTQIIYATPAEEEPTTDSS